MGGFIPTTFAILTYRAFEPTEISGLKAWYDASNINQADNSLVYQWLDKSGNESHMYQSSTSAMPTLQTNELNALPVVRFDGVDDFMNLTAPFDQNPASVSSIHASSISNNGNYYLQCNGTTAPVFYMFKVNGNVVNRLSFTASVSTGQTYHSTWSSDDTYFAIVGDTSPRVSIYKRSGDDFTKLSNPSTMPAGTMYDANFSSDDAYLAIAGTTTTTGSMIIYKRSGDAFTALANPTTTPAGNSFSCQFSPDTNFIAFGSALSPFIQVYSRSGDTFTKLTNPTTLPTSTINAISWLNNTTFACCQNSSNTILIYQYNGSNFELLTSFNVTGATGINEIKYSRNKNFLAVASNVSPFFYVYSVVGSTYTPISNPSSLPISTGRGLAWGLNDTKLFVSHSTSPNAQVYSFDGTTLTNLNKLNMFRNIGGTTIFCVKKTNSLTAQQYYFYGARNDENPRVQLALTTTGLNAVGGRRLDADTVQNINSASSLNFNMISGVFDYTNSDLYLYVDGKLQAQNTSFQTNGNTSDTNSASIRIGSRSSVDFFNGDIAEVLVFNRVLTTLELFNVHNYLSIKYNITLAT